MQNSLQHQLKHWCQTIAQAGRDAVAASIDIAEWLLLPLHALDSMLNVSCFASGSC
jgi:hypothetical protein